MLKNLVPVIALAVATAVSFSPVARADATADGFQKDFNAGAYGEAAAGLKDLAAAGEAKAKAGVGALAFVGAIERLGQSFYRYGMRLPEAREMAMMGPMMRLPIPANPTPEKLTYPAFRTVLENFVADLDRAEANMAALGDTEVKLPVDFTTIKLDFNSDGKPDAGETLGEVMQAVAMQTGPQQCPRPSK